MAGDIFHEGAGFLGGVRVLELADELGEYAGKLMAGLGADVIKIEPPAGEVTRTHGPFYMDTPDPERSLNFWHYNLGKRSVVLDLDTREGQERFHSLAGGADIVIDTRPRGYLRDKGLDYESLASEFPQLIAAAVSPHERSGLRASVPSYARDPVGP